MSRNGPVIYLAFIDLLTPQGDERLYPDDDMIARYTADPDAFAAAHFGLSITDYYEWLDTGGIPLCGHPTKTGALCKVQIGRGYRDVAEWKRLHRQQYCPVHGG